ncbi:hypothetical protein SERLADRAFT_364842 [Serpula lacrymans var. lacrymans S7.9]|uniref:Large ribosomal subunit protein mL40 n=1 Tax=Serpula lacrymans var. lacrymans (strain S7.9) TaxID=578457 RepID=F8NEV2_SERL9|nr:uncharacterized protein SERLADRAFT_364842 [Serpula lacrymans var. lacrymans S7.9]EGO31100.1 hypothetical protein SERLADRAFT_364842 [Serpula lacrymans var. lacrymans S7.9]
MSFSLFAPGSSKQFFRISQTSVRHAGRKAEATGGDPKKEILRRVLYPSNIRNKPTPIGTWRPDVGRALQRAIPSVQAHETIERAWLLHQRHQRKKREAELARKLECMKQAMIELEGIDSRLYMEANKHEDPRRRSEVEVEMMKSMSEPEKRAMESRARGLFPRELRIPTDTPPRAGWNYEWKPFTRPI